jgi:iron(III) transport system permease protein
MTRLVPRVLLLLPATTAAVSMVPLVYLLVRTFDAGGAQIMDVLARPRTWEVAWNSLSLAVAVAATCIALGIPAAWLVSRSNLTWHRGWLVLLALPLAVPSYVAAYAWVALFPGMSGFFGSWLVLSLVCMPYVVLPVVAAFRTSDAGAEHLARSLGMGPVRAFLRAGLPQVYPAAAAGGLLTALYTLSDFGTVSIMRYDAFTRVIYASYRASFDRTSAAVLSLILVVLALTFVVAEQLTRGPAKRYRVGSGLARTEERVHLGRWQLAGVSALAAYVTLALVVPAASLIRMITRSINTGIDTAELLDAATNTVLVSFWGAAVALALALPVGILAARYRGPSVRLTEMGAFTSHVLPGVVVGLSLVFFTLAVLPTAYQTVAVLAFAYGILFLPKALGSVRTTVAAIPPGYEMVARSAGLNPVRSFLKVTVPNTWVGIAAGATLAMLTAMKELPATLMLRPTGMDTLATRMWTDTEVADFAAAAPSAAALLVLAALPAFWLSQVAAGRSATNRTDQERRMEEVLSS